MSFWDSFDRGFEAVNKVRQNHALSTYRKDPSKGLNELMGVDPGMAQQIQMRQQQIDQQGVQFGQQQQDRTAQMQAGQQAAGGNLQGAQSTLYGAGDFQGAQQIQQQIQQSNAQQKAQLAQQVQAVGSFSYAAKKVPAGEQRQQWIMQNAQQYGLDPQAAVQHSDDQALDAAITQAVGVDQMLKLDAQQEKTQQQGEIQERRLDISQGNLDARRYGQTHARPRAASAPKAGRSGGQQLIPLGAELNPNDGW